MSHIGERVIVPASVANHVRVQQMQKEDRRVIATYAFYIALSMREYPVIKEASVQLGKVLNISRVCCRSVPGRLRQAFPKHSHDVWAAPRARDSVIEHCIKGNGIISPALQ